MQLGAHHLKIVVKPNPRDESGVVGHHKQRQRLREAFQKHLVRRMYRQQAHPRHVTARTPGRKACRL